MDKKLAGPIELLAQSWDVYKSRFWTFVAIQIVPIVAVIPSLLLILAIFYVSGNYGRFNEETLTQILVAGRFLIILVIPFLITGFVLQLCLRVALVVAVKDRAEQVGFVQAYKRAWRLLRSYLWVILLVGLAVVGAALLLIIPGIIVGVWLAFSGFVVITEGLHGRDALKRSRELVRSNWWGVFGRFLFLGLVGLVLLLVGGFVTLLWKQAGFAWVGDVVGIIGSFLWTPYAFIYTYLMYESLKTLKEPSTDTQAP